MLILLLTIFKLFIGSVNLTLVFIFLLVFSKEIFISGHIFSCDGEINLLEEYPILYFDCLMSSESKKKFLK